MFTTPCYIRKNTPELRKKLEELGYISNIFNNNDVNNIYVDKLGTYISVDIENHPYYIDCGTNEELFLALAALRDDSDYMQWFVNENGYFEMCFNDKVENYLCGYGVRKYRQIDETYHKATAEEIIEHFK